MNTDRHFSPSLTVWGQQKQHFRNQPEDQHVIEGNVAIIKCEVGNQAGRVQWAKDGFVLGKLTFSQFLLVAGMDEKAILVWISVGGRLAGI